MRHLGGKPFQGKKEEQRKKRQDKRSFGGFNLFKTKMPTNAKIAVSKIRNGANPEIDSG